MVPDQVKRRRPRLSGSQLSARSKKVDGEVLQREASACDIQDKSAEKEGSVFKKPRLHEQRIIEKAEAMKRSQTESTSVSFKLDSSCSDENSKRSVAISDLKLYIESLGGVLEGGWRIESHKKYRGGKVSKSFISPSNDRFRSQVEVAMHLGLFANLSKDFSANNDVANSQVDDEKEDNRATSNVMHLSLTRHNTKEGKLNVLKSPTIASSVHQKKDEFNMSYFQKETAQKLNSGKKSTKTQSKQYEAATVSSSLVNERCQDVLRNIISTDDFASLSNILNYASPSGTTEPLLKTLPGSIDLQLIRFRLSNGVYGQTPELFSSDISQVWKGIISFGKEQVALAQYLSDFSENLFKSKIGSLLHSKDIWDGPMGRGTPDLVKGDRFSSYFCKQSAKDNEVQLHGDSNMRYKPTCMQTYKSRQAAKKEIQSEKSLRPKSIIQDDNLSEACRSCGLILEHNCSVCKHCGAASNTQCIDPPPNNLEDCHLCPEGIVNEDRSREDESPKSDEATKKLCESTGLAGVDLRHKGGKDFLLSDSCEAACHRNSLNSDVNNPPDNSWYCPQCMEDFRYPSEKDEAVNHIPDEYNGSVRTHFPKDTFLEDDIRQNLSVLPSLIGMGSLDENTEQVAAESLTGLGSSSLHDNKVAESQLLLGNDTSSEKCGTENNTLVMSCSFSSNCISLQCLQPPLKTMPHNDWYWPVTTCKVCENDADDERILLCDACDEGYHIYCLNPPVDEKPNGAWLCSYCGPDLTVSKHIEVFKRRKRTEPKCSV